ncbi:glycosyltransferase family 4 protein [Streptomyces sp. NRRL S-813]|uniref:glycosyltransferase family 4 protein n=1 Tax=Streptomyces sp. NRRL S-813 TaxID=1463919 RepID=UPI0004BE64C3|nr:glycosyltransferase family 4 protein [Streptomyces sp. NRRL S-813]
MRVHFWSADSAGSSFYRAYLPGMSLQWLGHTVSVGMRLPQDWPAADVVVGCRVAQRDPSLMWRKLKDEGKRLVLDLDDDYFHIDPSNAHARQVWDTEMLGRLVHNMQVADLVTCCSEPLAAVLRDYAEDVRVIPNGLPAQYLGQPRDYTAADRPLFVGWAGTSSTVAELPEAVRALNRISQYPRPGGGVQVRIVGISPEHAMSLGLRGRRIGALGWVERMEHYLHAVAEWDVWCAPYRDTQFNRSKYPTKFLEASILGIPLIASDIEPYRRVIRHGENGFLVRYEHEWGKHLKQLADDPGLRQRIGMAARAEASGSILQAINVQWDAVLTPASERTAA